MAITRRELAEVAHLNGLGRRERVPVKKIAVGLRVEDAERHRLKPVRGSRSELDVIGVRHLLRVGGGGRGRTERDGLARVATIHKFRARRSIIAGCYREQGHERRHAGDGRAVQDIEYCIGVGVRLARHSPPRAARI